MGKFGTWSVGLAVLIIFGQLVEARLSSLTFHLEGKGDSIWNTQTDDSRKRCAVVCTDQCLVCSVKCEVCTVKCQMCIFQCTVWTFLVCRDQFATIQRKRPVSTMFFCIKKLKENLRLKLITICAIFKYQDPSLKTAFVLIC